MYADLRTAYYDLGRRMHSALHVSNNSEGSDVSFLPQAYRDMVLSALKALLAGILPLALCAHLQPGLHLGEYCSTISNISLTAMRWPIMASLFMKPPLCDRGVILTVLLWKTRWL